MAVAVDSGLLAVGAVGDGSNNGAVWLVRDGGNGWADVVAADVDEVDGGRSDLTTAANDYFGRGVAVYGGAVAVGADGVDTGGSDRGAVVMMDAAFAGFVGGRRF